LKINKLNGIIALGLIAIIGILIAQLLWTKEAFTLEEKKFGQKANIALLEVAKQLYAGTNNLLPSENPVQKISNDYYIVNVNNDFEPEVLEYYLKSEFAKATLNTDFEYAIYNCQSDEMVYGNYVSRSEKNYQKSDIFFPKHKNLVYYFAIRFPDQATFLFSSLKFWFLLSGALLVILLVYVYSIFTILQQRKYSELQKDFINNMTHEFKTPLSSILIASNYLANQNLIKKDEKLKKYSKIIIDQSKKLNSHIEKILTIAKSDSSQMALKKETIAVLPIIEEVIENMKLKNEAVSIALKTNLPFLEIEADVFHFTNIIYNLVDNSIKYCNINPQITIEVIKTNNQITLLFRDNGIGISPKKVPFIFDKFYREATTKSNEVAGFGLGLYYVKKICDLHKWKINAKNNPEIGITVTLQIK
jgi:two-component system, OmpR family, phosphate regulon sensor histidine kinase PhoR